MQAFINHPHVSLGVSSLGVFTIRAQTPIIRECRQTKISERPSGNVCVIYATVRASAKKHLLTGAASYGHTCRASKQAQRTPALRPPKCLQTVWVSPYRSCYKGSEAHHTWFTDDSHARQHSHSRRTNPSMGRATGLCGSH
ncbi:hypothetical protein PflSS101_3918 [Pseudomonas lactis]|uniref:Uncharacterized protein n=1 Tax=Pseudomonas lactis TaxID=1615674 RepID=I4KDE1_9PSED|nr:hypothetical protein PflSS101_3918 [Pseudomonas lactis]